MTRTSTPAPCHVSPLKWELSEKVGDIGKGGSGTNLSLCRKGAKLRLSWRANIKRMRPNCGTTPDPTCAPAHGVESTSSHYIKHHLTPYLRRNSI